MNYISMFSGIEAATVAFKSLGWEAMAFAEIEPFPSAVLAYHYPTIPNVGDITQHDWSQYEGECDLVIGGPPCQAFSIAGLRRSLEDARGNLSLEYIKAVDAIDPRWIITENVPGWLNTKDNAFGCFLAGLAGESVPLEPPGGRWSNAGCVFGPKRTVAWRVLDAQYFGVAQRRRRVFVVASPRNGGNPIEILFKSEGVRRDTPPSRKKGERITPTVTGGPPFSRTGNERVEAEAMVFQQNTRDELRYVGGDGQIVGALVAEAGMKQQNYVMAHGQGNERAEAMVYRYQNEQVGIVQDTISATLRKESATTDERSVPAYVMAHGQGNAEIRMDGSPSLTCNHDLKIGATVRRLTPTTCERLQGFQDNYTLVPYRGKPATDGPRYKALGNSMAVPCIFWIGDRIEAVERVLCP